MAGPNVLRIAVAMPYPKLRFPKSRGERLAPASRWLVKPVVSRPDDARAFQWLEVVPRQSRIFRCGRGRRFLSNGVHIPNTLKRFVAVQRESSILLIQEPMMTDTKDASSSKGFVLTDRR